MLLWTVVNNDHLFQSITTAFELHKVLRPHMSIAVGIVTHGAALNRPQKRWRLWEQDLNNGFGVITCRGSPDRRFEMRKAEGEKIVHAGPFVNKVRADGKARRAFERTARCIHQGFVKIENEKFAIQNLSAPPVNI